MEDFWSLYNQIEMQAAFWLGLQPLQGGVFPDWEDPRNAAGGRWIVNLERQERSQLLDSYWLETRFFLIGEHADTTPTRVLHFHHLKGKAKTIWHLLLLYNLRHLPQKSE